MDWQVCMGFLILVFVSVTLWGATQGWFSPPLKTQTPPSANKVSDKCDKERELRRKIEALEGKIFELTNLLNEKIAIINDLNKKLQELMNAINDLSSKLQEEERKNAVLSASLKNALDDLAKCRRELQACRAELLAKRIIHEKCKMTPETNNLLR
jgi:chromosome segregation ATPase